MRTLSFACRLHGFLISCDKHVCLCMWVLKFASGLTHAGKCNRGQLSTALCQAARHTPASAESNRAALCRTGPCRGVPHGAMLLLSHAAPEQMARLSKDESAVVPDSGPRSFSNKKRGGCAFKFLWVVIYGPTWPPSSHPTLCSESRVPGQEPS